MNDPTFLVQELRAKAWQSTRYRKSAKRAEDHICYRAAEKIEELCRGENGSIPIRSVREIFTRLFNLTNDQRAYSWHEIQYALSEVEKAKND